MFFGGFQGRLDDHPPRYPCHRRLAHGDSGTREGHCADAGAAFDDDAFFAGGTKRDCGADLGTVGRIWVVASVLDYRAEDFLTAGSPVYPLATVQDEHNILANGKMDGDLVHRVSGEQGRDCRLRAGGGTGAGGVTGAHAFAPDRWPAVIALGSPLAGIGRVHLTA